ncbi:hypothetical protein FUAX_28100 [Fulvitalea axinellae]|uniref:Polysaccharide biosynthesis protein C-terminal domain-containing protein n=1 Tax=Fulvitalea axinellae TaxID=1182444 RepID=A0AAU9CJQ9_9BACT|nr:hypothetical protein FUAX_28100 [Fulvitalea axinellae]
MGIVLRQSLKSSIVNYAAVALGAVINIWFFPEYLSKSEIGIYRYVFNVPLLIAGFLQFGASSSIDHFYPIYSKNNNDRNRFLSFVFLYPLPLFVAGASLFFLFRKPLDNFMIGDTPEMAPYLILLVPLTLICIYRSLGEALCRSAHRIVVPSVLRDLAPRFAILFLLPLLAYQIIDFQEMAIGLTLFWGLFVIILLFYGAKLNPFHLTNFKAFLTPERRKEIFTYNSFVFIGSAGGLIIANTDTLMIPKLTGFEDLGVYSIAFYIGSVIEVPRKALSQISLPIISKAIKENDIKQVESLYKKTAINQLIVGGWLFLGIACNTDFIFHLMPKGDEYVQGLYVILFIGGARLIDMAFGVNNEILLYSKYYKLNHWITIAFAVLMIALNYIFIPAYGINGAAFATFLSVAIYNLSRFLIVWKKIGTQPFTLKTGITLGLLALTAFIALNISFSNFWITFLLRGTWITLAIVAGVLGFKLSDDFSGLFRKFFNKG